MTMQIWRQRPITNAGTLVGQAFIIWQDTSKKLADNVTPDPAYLHPQPTTHPHPNEITVPFVDSLSNPVLDANGKQYYLRVHEWRLPPPVLDASGNQINDGGGHPLYAMPGGAQVTAVQFFTACINETKLLAQDAFAKRNGFVFGGTAGTVEGNTF